MSLVATQLHQFATRPIAPVVIAGIEWHLRRPTSYDLAVKGSTGLLAVGSGGTGRGVGTPDPAVAAFRLVCASVAGANRPGEPREALALVMDEAKANPPAGILYVGDLPAVVFRGLADAVIALVGEGGDVLESFLRGDLGAPVPGGEGRSDGPVDGAHGVASGAAGSGDPGVASA